MIASKNNGTPPKGGDRIPDRVLSGSSIAYYLTDVSLIIMFLLSSVDGNRLSTL